MRTNSNTTLGVSLNVAASVLFAVMFAYTALLSTLSGEEIYGWRILLTLPCLTLFIWFKGYWPLLVNIYQRLFCERHFWAKRLISSLFMGIQQWLFMWGPGNGYALAISLGYFIMPITMVVVGRFAFNDRISHFQQFACLFAILGISYQLAISQTLAWPTLVVCLGYPIYFWLRRKTNTDNIGGLWFDMILNLPLGIFFVVHNGSLISELGSNSYLPWLVLGLGLLSALSLALQSLSAPYLNISLFGLLSYVEPMLLLLAAILLGESISLDEWPTYIAIWLAVLMLIIEGAWSLNRQKKYFLKRKKMQ